MKYVYYKTHHGDLNTAFLMEAAGCIASNKEVKKLLEECVSKFRLYDSIKMEDFIEFVKDKKIISTAYGKKTYPVLDVLVYAGHFKRYIDYGIKSGDVLKKGNKTVKLIVAPKKGGNYYLVAHFIEEDKIEILSESSSKNINYMLGPYIRKGKFRGFSKPVS